MLTLTAFLSSLAVLTPPPAPPSDLRPWIDYAREVVDTGPACPPSQSCVQLQRVELQGRTDQGILTLTFVGNNLGRAQADKTLLEPASTFAVTRATWRSGSGYVALRGDAWEARVMPGPFVIEVAVSFDPEASVPIGLGGPVASIVDRLEQGSLSFDESSDRHGGIMFLESKSRRDGTDQALSLRATRAFTFGSVVTFTYHFTVTGLREQTRVQLPRLGGETIESLEPDIPYSVSAKAVEVTLTPGRSTVQANGHFAEVPGELVKPASLPFEYWLFDADPRHPAELTTDGVEIDPAEVTDLTPGARSRAFFLVEEQRLTVTPVEVSLDVGRQGAGTAHIDYFQGRSDRWVGSLRLTSTTAPESDRITVPTPEPPHYAESGGVAVRMFADGEILSLRVRATDERLEPIRVQWREGLSTNVFLSAPTLRMPGQSLHLDDEAVDVHLQPGYVPIAVLGVEHTHGHLIDGLHIYAILIALLGIAFARAGRFPMWAAVITAVLLAGLYTVEGFPRVALLVLLAGCAVLVRLPAGVLATIRQHRFVHGALSLVWITVLLVTLVPSVVYIKDRVFAALHPWSDSDTTMDDSSVASFVDLREEEAQSTPEVDAIEPQVQQKVGRLMGSLAGGKRLQKGLVNMSSKIPKATEKTIRPVAFDAPGLPERTLSYSYGSLLPGREVSATVILAGPLLRGLWMFAECFGLGAVLALLVIRARRWWSVSEVES